MRKLLTAVCLFAFSLCLIFADSFASSDNTTYASLCTLDGDDITSVMPADSMIFEKASELKDLDNSFTVVINKTFEYPSSWNGLSLEEKMLKVYNILLGISSQKGITYISRTAGYKPKTLFEESYCLSDCSDTKSRIEDLSVDTVPPSLSLYSYQKDNRFGGNVYEVDYKASQSEVFMEIVNCTDMRFMGFSCVNEGQLSLFVDVYLTENGVSLISMATVVDKKPEIKILFYTVDLRGSFERRIEALSDWFVGKVQ